MTGCFNRSGQKIYRFSKQADFHLKVTPNGTWVTFCSCKLVIFRCWGAERIAHEEGCSRFAAEKKEKRRHLPRRGMNRKVIRIFGWKLHY